MLLAEKKKLKPWAIASSKSGRRSYSLGSPESTPIVLEVLQVLFCRYFAVHARSLERETAVAISEYLASPFKQTSGH
jgi:hypothetical protein